MKELYENWRRFLTEEEEEETTQPPETSDGQKYLAKPKTQQALTVQKDPKKDPINNPNTDQHGTFVHLMSDEIENQLLGLEKSPDGTTITIDLPKYLNSLYPPNLFPGGWEKVWNDAQAIRKNKQYGVGGKLTFRPKPLKIAKNDKEEGLFGIYIPKVDTLFINFAELRKKGKDPLQTIVHELGHCIINGPSETRINSETEIQIAKERGYDIGKGYRLKSIETGKKTIEDELSNIGRIILKQFIKERPEQYKKIKDIVMADRNVMGYILSRTESQQRYYRPMKFWFAKILQRIRKEGKIQRGELPNLGDPNYYVVLQSYATPQEYEKLAFEIDEATKGTPIPYIMDFIIEKIRVCKKDPRSQDCLLSNRGIYPEIISTVKTEPQQSTSQVA